MYCHEIIKHCTLKESVKLESHKMLQFFSEEGVHSSWNRHSPRELLLHSSNKYMHSFLVQIDHSIFFIIKPMNSLFNVSQFSNDAFGTIYFWAKTEPFFRTENVQRNISREDVVFSQLHILENMSVKICSKYEVIQTSDHWNLGTYGNEKLTHFWDPLTLKFNQSMYLDMYFIVLWIWQTRLMPKLWEVACCPCSVCTIIGHGIERYIRNQVLIFLPCSGGRLHVTSQEYAFFTEVTTCTSAPCQNGGTCSVNGAAYSCACASGYTGDSCETSKLHKIIKITGAWRTHRSLFLSICMVRVLRTSTPSVPWVPV